MRLQTVQDALNQQKISSMNIPKRTAAAAWILCSAVLKFHVWEYSRWSLGCRDKYL